MSGIGIGLSNRNLVCAICSYDCIITCDGDAVNSAREGPVPVFRFDEELIHDVAIRRMGRAAPHSPFRWEEGVMFPVLMDTGFVVYGLFS